MGRRSRPRAKTGDVGVLDWIRDSDPEDIAEALLAVDEAKAALVVKALLERAEGEMDRLVRSVGAEFEQDPVGTTLRGVFGTLSRLSRGR